MALDGFQAKPLKISYSDVCRFLPPGAECSFFPACFMWAPHGAARRDFDRVSPQGVAAAHSHASRRQDAARGTRGYSSPDPSLRQENGCLAKGLLREADLFWSETRTAGDLLLWLAGLWPGDSVAQPRSG